MRDIHTEQIAEAVAQLCIRANLLLPEDALDAIRAAGAQEQSPVCRALFADLERNAAAAAEDYTPLCQDTGLAVVFAEVGQDVHITGGLFEEAVNEGVRRGYTEGYLRKSVAAMPLYHRVNTGDNTPAMLTVRLVPGEQIRLTVAPKGAGSENMSALAMLTPADGERGVREFVLDTVRKAGPNPCPPLIVGVGIGGSMDKAALIAKQALLRPVGEASPDADIARLEQTLLGDINALGIGAQGFGGSVTALAVHIETMACHIASLPVAVNLQCHCARHAQTVL